MMRSFLRNILAVCGGTLLLTALGCGATTATTPAGPPPPNPTVQATPAQPAPVAEAPSGSAAEPATSVAAAKVIDLGKLPLHAKAEPPAQKHLAALSYVVPAGIKEAFGFHQQQLEKQGWKEVTPLSSSDDYAAATYAKGGYLVAMSAMNIDGKSMVHLTNLGNVPPKSLPVPADAKLFYGGNESVMYVTESTPEETRAALQKLLIDAGWLPYGEAADSLFLRKKAILLTATAGAAPAQGGKTMITYSTVLMRREMPAPTEKVTDVSYSDEPLQVTFDAQMTEDEVVDFYKKQLAPEGWEPTTEQANKIDFEKFLIFRNPGKDLMEVTLRDLGEGKTRVALEFQTAEEVAAEEARFKEALAKKKKEENKPLAKVAVKLPAKAENVAAEKSSLEFTVPSGTARAAAKELAAALQAAGWNGEFTIAEDVAGAAMLTKDDHTISLDYNDTGVLPAEITVRAIGVELEVAGK
jgi:hypothetical protein